MEKIKIGVIGGSGIYEIDGVKVIDEILPETPWGKPSDKITIADVQGVKTAFLPRHGKGHFIIPHEVNSRANIAALKMTGVEEIIAFSAVGSLKEEVKPLDFALPNQIIDRTKMRPGTFFGNGIVAHISFPDPFCERIHEIILPAAQKLGIKIHTKETVVCIEGPSFSTRAESHMYRSWGGTLINMSALPEAKLAREAEICYAMICMATDYDCWKEDEEHVSLEMLIGNLNENAARAKALLKEILPHMSQARTCACKEAIKNAIFTAPEKQDPEQKAKLKAIFPDYF
ncbi:MAG: S-methyl-5'-thioadenosine phosphorylase [Spirochaetes bacterium]|nr:S-methyl-5'-thioadenosine phosphorylase [Spirochaetota bacterium]